MRPESGVSAFGVGDDHVLGYENNRGLTGQNRNESLNAGTGGA